MGINILIGVGMIESDGVKQKTVCYPNFCIV